jgi:hypothetical protein
MRYDSGTQASQLSHTGVPATGDATDATSPRANTSPSQDNQKVDPLWQKFQEERRIREEQEREARESLKRKETERQEQEKWRREQKEAAQR